MTWGRDDRGFWLKQPDAHVIEMGSDMELCGGLWQPKAPGWTISFDLNGPSYVTLPPYMPFTFTYGGWWNAPRRNPRPDKMDVSRTEPFIGWKTLGVVLNGDGVWLKGQRGHYGVFARAVCPEMRPHHVPDWDCTCGFYAMKTPPPEPEYGAFRAEVELFGTVIEAENGYRAECQRVLSLQAFRTCSKDGCDRQAAVFKVNTNPEKRGTVIARCHKHRGGEFLALADLTAKIGTEIRWIDSEKAA